jgi:hypothetical protein
MSVEAISWALNLAPVPTGRSGQPSSACKFVLVGLANHAGPVGSNTTASAVPSGAPASAARSTAASDCTVGTHDARHTS